MKILPLIIFTGVVCCLIFTPVKRKFSILMFRISFSNLTYVVKTWNSSRRKANQSILWRRSVIIFRTISTFSLLQWRRKTLWLFCEFQLEILFWVYSDLQNGKNKKLDVNKSPRKCIKAEIIFAMICSRYWKCRWFYFSNLSRHWICQCSNDSEHEFW